MPFEEETIVFAPLLLFVPLERRLMELGANVMPLLPLAPPKEIIDPWPMLLGPLAPIALT